MYRFLILPVLFLFTGLLSAQTNSYTSASDSDPEARAMLEKIRKKYDAYRTLEADFELELRFPGATPEVQKGKIQRKGDLVRFRLGEQEGLITDQAAYLIMHSSKEVSINDLPEEGEVTGVLTPQTLFSFYEGDEYIVGLQGKEKANGRELQLIELKPVNRDLSDFTKLRLAVDRTRNEIASVKAFTRDGTSYTFTLTGTKGDVSLPATTFVFDKAQFPGYHVEDLRF